MKTASLGSGSRGNATIVSHSNTYIMIDCGFSTIEIEKRLQRLNIEARALSAILVTHEHGDHVRGVGPLSRKYNIPVYMTHGTRKAKDFGVLPKLIEIDVENEIEIGDLQVKPFPVPHDAEEPCQFVVTEGDKELGILTDTGMITPHIKKCLERCDALLLEANHDEELLATGQYPESLKQRVASNYGHLSNKQSAKFLELIDPSRYQFLVAMHVSEKNNSSDLVRMEFSNAIGCDSDEIQIANQDSGFDWLELN